MSEVCSTLFKMGGNYNILHHIERNNRYINLQQKKGAAACHTFENRLNRN